jgi:dTDP-4-dehydrorhamnose reductase
MATALAPTYTVVGRARSELDITSAIAVRDAVAGIAPTLIVNCAAYTDVDGAERNPVAALAVNAMAVRTLARLARERDITLVHYSTDFVFDGTHPEPHTEAEAPNPRGAYAASKLLGEWFAAEAPRHYVLRVASLFGGIRAKSSVDKILANVVAGVEVRAFADRTVSPSFVGDVIVATQRLLDTGAPFGLYHCVNSGQTTWSGLAREIAQLAGRPDASIIDTAMRDAGLLASRPQFAALSNAKLTATGIEMPSWQDALRRYVGSRLAASAG